MAFIPVRIGAVNVATGTTGLLYTMPGGAAITNGNTVVGWVKYVNDDATQAGGITVIDNNEIPQNVIIFPPLTGNVYLALFWKTHVTGGPASWQVFMTGLPSAGTMLMQAEEWSGFGMGATIDPGTTAAAVAYVASSTGANTMSSGNLSTSIDGDFIWSCAIADTGAATVTPGTGYAIELNDATDQAYTQFTTQSTHGTIAGTWQANATGSNYAIGALALTQQAPAGRVGIDAIGSGFDTNASAAILFTGLTVSASLSNSAMLLVVVINSGGVTWSTLTPAATWDAGGTNQTMTLIGRVADPGAITTVELWGLIAPTAGNKTLEYDLGAGFSNEEIYLNAISLRNVKQTSVATAFTNYNSASASGTSPTFNVTSAANNLALGVFANSAANDALPFHAPVNASTWFEQHAATVNTQSAYAPGVVTTTFTGDTFLASQAWCGAGVNIVLASIITVTIDIGGSNDHSLLVRSGNERRRTIW